MACIWGPPGHPPHPPQHTRNKVLHFCLSKRNGHLPSLSSPMNQLKIGLGMQFTNGWCYRSTHSTLGGKKKEMENICYEQILIIINHASVYSTVIILFVGSLWDFIPPWKHWSRLRDIQHGLLGLTCKLIISDFSSAFSLLGRQINTAFTNEAWNPLALLSCWGRLNVVRERNSWDQEMRKSW